MRTREMQRIVVDATEFYTMITDGERSVVVATETAHSQLAAMLTLQGGFVIIAMVSL